VALQNLSAFISQSVEDDGVKQGSTLHRVYNPDRFGRFYLEEYMVLNMKTGNGKVGLEEMSKGENIVKWMKWQRISWLGHLERVEAGRMPKNIFTQELEGTRIRRRHRKRWKKEVERDLQVLGVRR